MLTALIIGIGASVAAMAVIWTASNWFRSADSEKVKNRLLGTNKAKEKREKGKTQAALIQPTGLVQRFMVLRLLDKYNKRLNLQDLIEQAGLKWDVGRFIHSCMAMFLVGFGLAWMLLPPAYRQAAWLTGLVGGSLPGLYLLRLRGGRMRKFEEQFPESLEFVARSMRAGHAFSVSLEMIHREFQEPLASEFRRTFEEHNLGLPLDVSLEKLAKRVPLLDVHFFVSAVMLQKRTGGNLAEILDKLAYVIRERFKLRGKIRAISAHGRMTGMALSTIPAVVAGMMFWVNPEYVRFFFTDETGNYMLLGAVAMQIIGYLVIKKIVSIEV
jgi:tight adherence protein B